MFFSILIMVVYMYYANNFLAFSIFGHAFETVIYKILKVTNKSGFMYLFWTPFYGTGVVIDILVYKYLSKKIKNKKKRIIVLFLSLFIILSLLEYIGGLLLLKLFNKVMWSYTNFPFHIGRYVSIPTSLLWVIMSFFYLFVVKKYSDRLIKKINPLITIILCFIFLCDIFFSIIKLS